MEQYFIAQIKITDQIEYNKYLAQCDEIFSKYQGKYIVVDNTPEVLEGEWDCTRTVIIRFHSKEAFTNWYYSEEYQEILKHRLAGAICNTVVVSSLEDS